MASRQLGPHAHNYLFLPAYLSVKRKSGKKPPETGSLTRLETSGEYFNFLEGANGLTPSTKGWFLKTQSIGLKATRGDASFFKT